MNKQQIKLITFYQNEILATIDISKQLTQSDLQGVVSALVINMIKDIKEEVK